MGDDLDLSKLPEPSDSLRSRLGAWRTALALAADTAPPQPGLRGQEAGPAGDAARARLARRRSRRGRRLSSRRWAGACSAISSADVMARQERLRRAIGVLEPEFRRQEEERRRAAVATAREAALDAFASQGPRLARVMEAFSLAAPADIALFSRSESSPASPPGTLVVEGQAEGRRRREPRTPTFNRFLKALDASRLVGRHGGAGPHFAPRTSGPGGRRRPGRPPRLRLRKSARPAQAVEHAAALRPRAPHTSKSRVTAGSTGSPCGGSRAASRPAGSAEEARRLQEAALAPPGRRVPVARPALVRARRSRPPAR
ncbi:MAG: hypothetical protein MZW92_09500 [Comamonadaceae bacterium]|nr:hypothetical protein [Comamonadaceae bacterium]